MKTKLKHIFFLAILSLAATACGGRMAKPVSGLDVSLLSPSLLTISPKTADGKEIEQISKQLENGSGVEDAGGTFQHQQLTINN